jgi:hypothetical protein
MVIVMHELGFVEGKPIGSGFVNEQIAVIRHVEDCHELDAPRIALFAKCLIN